MKISNIKTILTALAVTVGLSSCMKSNDNITPVYISGVSLIQASPTTEKLDVYLDNTKASITDFTFGTKMDYLNAYTGTRTFQVAKKGTQTSLASKQFKLDAEVGYSVFLINKLEDIDFLFLKDDLSIPATGKAKIRFVNASPDAAPLTFAINGQANDLSTTKAYKEFTEFITVDAAEKVTFNVKDAGGIVLATIENTKIESGKTYTIWAKGLKAATDETKFGAAIFTHK